MAMKLLTTLDLQKSHPRIIRTSTARNTATAGVQVVTLFGSALSPFREVGDDFFADFFQFKVAWSPPPRNHTRADMVSFRIIPQEREVRAKHLQMLSGLRSPPYWVSCYIFDNCAMLVTTILTVAIFGLFRRTELVGTVDRCGTSPWPFATMVPICAFLSCDTNVPSSAM